jgi:SAM-dependent methyltransferase
MARGGLVLSRLLRGRGGALELALISFLCLYFEMIVIRWLASDIRMFAYFKNLPLLAAFLGLGLGCARTRQRPFELVPLLCFAFAAVVAFSGPLGLTHVYIPQQDDFKFFSDASGRELQHPVPFLVAKFFVVVVGMFFLVVELFAALGTRLGTLFDTLPPTRAYSFNLVASLAGIWAFAALSWLGWPPAGWFAVGFVLLLPFLLRSGEKAGPWWRRRPVALGLLAATLALVALAPGATRWSPYQRIDVAPYVTPDEGGHPDLAGYTLRVNHDYLQTGFDLREGFVREHPDPVLATWRGLYEPPYRLVQPKRVLVVGAGMGNDVAAAIRNGAEHVDAVEIDPTILELGRELHPEHPYSSPRVRRVNDDARSFFTRAAEPYDLIVFGLLDSQTLLSSMSSLRLDSYVYTLESLAQAHGLLTPGGYVSLSFATDSGEANWLGARLYQMLIAATGQVPAAISLDAGVVTMYFLGPDVHARLAADPELGPLAVDPAVWQRAVPPATDDWPFIYLRDRGVPLYPYGVLLVVLLLSAGGLVLAGLRRTGGGLNAPMFLLGAAFMLVEVKSISQLSLLFGSTWLVNAVSISAILVLILLANLFVAWRRPTRVGPAYALLALALVVDYLVPVSSVAGQGLLVKTVVGTVLPVLPLLFAGIIFGTLFARTDAPAHAFGSNLLGALAGGLLEYASMALGFKALGLLALVLYAGSWLALQRRAAWTGRPRMAAEPRAVGSEGRPAS